MIKNGKVEAGKTPSEVSGRKSDTIKQGAAIRYTEDAPSKRIEDLKIPSVKKDDE